MKLPMLTNSGNKQSATFTMMVIGFISCVAWLWISMFVSLKLPFDATASTIFLAPLFTLYFGRRWMEKDSSSQHTTE